MDIKEELNEKLRESCCMGDGEAIYKCLIQGADINSKNKMNGWTSLHWAAKRGHTDLVEILLGKNADPTIRNNTNQTAFDVASSENVKKVLRKYGHYEQADASTPASTPQGVSQDFTSDTCLQRIRNKLMENDEVTGFTPISKAGVLQTPVVTPTNKPSELKFVPSYLANPVFPYANKENRSAQSFGKISKNTTSVQEAEEELVLKVRHANSEEKDFIEIELDKNKLTFDNLKKVCLAELEISECHEIQKVRKLPDTIIRKDKDVQRLKQFQEIEIITRISSNLVSSTTH